VSADAARSASVTSILRVSLPRSTVSVILSPPFLAWTISPSLSKFGTSSLSMALMMSPTLSMALAAGEPAVTLLTLTPPSVNSGSACTPRNVCRGGVPMPIFAESMMAYTVFEFLR
jgi:hypothetical protein